MFLPSERFRQSFGMDPRRLTRPVISQNSSVPDLEYPAMMSVQQQLLADAGTAHLWLQVWTGYPYGHIAVTRPQLLDLIHAMDRWITTGRRPDPADQNVFPSAHHWAPTHDPGVPWWIDGAADARL